jgi:CHAT domain-containing protein
MYCFLKIVKPFCIATLLSMGIMFCQAQDETSVLAAAETAIKTRKFDDAIVYCKQVIDHVDSTADRTLWINANNTLALAYLKKRSSDAALPIIKRALSATQKYLPSNDPVIADCFFLLGMYYDQVGKPEQALINHERALNVRRARLGQQHGKVAESYKGVGEVYFFSLRDYKRANLNFVKSIEITEKQAIQDPYQLYSGYFNLSRVNRRLGDMDKALTYAFKAYSVINANPDYHSYLDRCYTLLGDVYYSRTDYSKSVEYLSKGIEQSIATEGKNNYALIAKYTNLGVSLTQMPDFKGAFRSFRESARIFRLHEHHNSDLLRNNFLFMGWSQQKSGQMDSARIYFMKSLSLQLGDYGVKHIKTSEVYDYLANLFKETKQLDSAASYAQRSLIAAIPEFDEKNIFKNPEISNIADRYDLFLKFATKGSILLELYKSNSSQIKYLGSALNSFRVADELMERNRNSYQGEDSKLFFADHYHAIYQKAIETTFLLFQKSQNESYCSQALMFMEKNKAYLLAEALQKAEMFSEAGIPDSIRANERTITSKLARNRSALEKIKASNDTTEQERIQTELYELGKQHQQLMDAIARDYPSYFQVKYKSVASLEEMKQTANDRDAVIIEYFWSEHGVYIIGVTEDNVIFRRIADASELENQVFKYVQQLRPDNASGGKEKFSAFVSSATSVYESFLSPILSEFPDPKNLIIIRDGILWTIPFESLLVSKARSEEENYQVLDYLLRHYTVSYAQSANLLVKNSDRRNRSSNSEVLGFSFSASDDTNASDQTRISNDTELPGSARELDAIASLFSGSFFRGQDATEHKFISVAPQFGILHLAVHGVADETKQFSGSLLFKHAHDSIDDGELEMSELYNLKLNAKLVVLSACESGVGKVYKGEGVFSISRAFDYAGCPSSVLTLWKIGDLSSAQIMTTFYEQLRDGRRIDVALRNAKLHYLETAHWKLAHPAYWAAFVPVGNTDPVIQNRWIGMASIFFGIVIIAATAFFVRSRNIRQQRMQKKHAKTSA